MIKKIIILIALLSITLTNAYAQVNPELVDSLNKVLILEMASFEQCDFHSTRFGLKMPYHRILLKKQETIDTLTNLITNIRGEIFENTVNIEKKSLASSALNSDAYMQIQLVQEYDAILARFGHPDVQRIITVSRNLTQQHFMLLTNTAQKMIDNNKLEDRLAIQ